jgi:CRISPR system Cascade subunit CasD
MQSWGTQSAFSVRDTGLEPSKSGVIGLLCAALGRPRSGPLNDLSSLKMGVRVDREGQMARDFHTAGGEHRAGLVLGRDPKGRPMCYGVAKANGSEPGTVTSSRYYLEDAEFLVGLEGADLRLLESLHGHLRQPVWPLYLGRKSFVPSLPVWIPDGLWPDATLETSLKPYPWRRRRKVDDPPARLRLVVDVEFVGEPRRDVPLSFAERRFGIRHVRTEFVEREQIRVENEPCT